ncbi:MAG: DUF4347 domain-containing protein [Phycisphaerales bacterium]|nr:DUF4347 domain-containing protein [Phycisphaerales bacterium]MCI0630256.1 DUF4347 domain-containing protein [Phycisphaerales bacterium]MCI0676103.1 DUF4347 domain-containing protein [Phycisphaerales bacterium]
MKPIARPSGIVCSIIAAVCSISSTGARATPVPCSSLAIDPATVPLDDYPEFLLDPGTDLTILSNGDHVVDVRIAPPIALLHGNDYICGTDYSADLTDGTATINFVRRGPYFIRIIRQSGAIEGYLAAVGVRSYGTTCQGGASKEIDCGDPDIVIVANNIGWEHSWGDTGEIVDGIQAAKDAICAKYKANGNQPIDVAINAHGSSGSIDISGEKLSSENVDEFMEGLAGKISSLTIFSCSVAAGEDGQSLICELEIGLGADVTGFTGKVSDTPPDQEQAWFTSGEPYSWQACGGSSNSCFEPHAEPGCEDATCCSQVCELDPFCCQVQWDFVCVNYAFSLNCTQPQQCVPAYPNDCADGPQQVTGVEAGPVTVPYSTVGANTDGNPGSCGLPGADLWYLLQAPSDGILSVDTCDSATTYDSTLAVYDVGDGTYDPQDIAADQGLAACDDDGCGVVGAGSNLELEVQAGTHYLVRVGGYQGASGNGLLRFELIDKESLFSTGPPRPVVLNGVPNTLLGWSSGNLSASAPQRWTAQPFTLPAAPAGSDGWLVTRIEVAGFSPAGAVNERLNYIIWNRNGLNAPVDGDQVAQGTVVFPVPQDHPTMPGADAFLHVIETELVPLSLVSSGSYWLTVYADNGSGGAVQSNFAWFTNADFGINNLDGGGNAFMWRSFMFPIPGFEFFTSPAIAVDPAVNSDPKDLYNTSFRLRGRPAPPDSCPADINDDFLVNINDLLGVISDWGACTGCAGDIDHNGLVNVIDLLSVIGSWGPCQITLQACAGCPPSSNAWCIYQVTNVVAGPMAVGDQFCVHCPVLTVPPNCPAAVFVVPTLPASTVNAVGLFQTCQSCPAGLNTYEPAP